MTEQVKPCPFCGSKNIVFCASHGNRLFHIGCADCEAHAQYAYSRKEAIGNWNRRAEETSEMIDIPLRII